MSAVVQQLLTAEDLARLHGGEYVELIDGVVKELPMPKRPHGFVSNRFACVLTNHVLSHSLGRVFSNDTFVVTQRNPDRVRGADVCYWSYARSPKGQPVADVCDEPPELVVEVRSPTDRWSGILTKVAEYLNVGVNVVIVIDPEVAAATVFRQNEIQQVLHNGDELTIPDILPGFIMKLSQLFEDLG